MIKRTMQFFVSLTHASVNPEPNGLNEGGGVTSSSYLIKLAVYIYQVCPMFVQQFRFVRFVQQHCGDD